MYHRILFLFFHYLKKKMFLLLYHATYRFVFNFFPVDDWKQKAQFFILIFPNIEENHLVIVIKSKVLLKNWQCDINICKQIMTYSHIDFRIFLKFFVQCYSELATCWFLCIYEIQGNIFSMEHYFSQINIVLLIRSYCNL